MKSSVAFPFLAILAAQGASAACVDGHRETIAPGYEVEYKCGIYRSGDVHNNIKSERDCALLAQQAGRPISSYHPGTKRCIVGAEDGKEGKNPSVTYMVKVEDPFAEEEEEDDPFADCETQKDSLLKKLQSTQAQLDKCNADALASSSGGGSCNIRKSGKNHYRQIGGPLRNCRDKCLADPKCLSYDYYPCNSICRHFDKPLAEVESTDHESHIFNDRDCQL
ncbi:hypothetical protein DER44DRAFT_819467 [Fusarium oxysporum]|nr:hypothetical protein DER44DRAFT_819467 [Fusarium oxysporum]